MVSEYQIKKLESILMESERIKIILERMEKVGLENYYIAAGSINQTVFNYYHHYPLDYGIEDVDIVYFDEDLSYEKEDSVIQQISKLLSDVDVSLDIKNEARVHLWYPEKYHLPMNPYSSLEEAIKSWISTVTCIGVRLKNHNLEVYAPFGLDDLFDMVIRPTNENSKKDQYIKKSLKWKEKWPLLTIIPWKK